MFLSQRIGHFYESLNLEPEIALNYVNIYEILLDFDGTNKNNLFMNLLKLKTLNERHATLL